MELAQVFTFEDRIVEHGGGAHEIDAVLLHVARATRLFPLEHDTLYAPADSRRQVIWRGQCAAGKASEIAEPPVIAAPLQSAHQRQSG